MGSRPACVVFGGQLPRDMPAPADEKQVDDSISGKVDAEFLKENAAPIAGIVVKLKFLCFYPTYLSRNFKSKTASRFKRCKCYVDSEGRG